MIDDPIHLLNGKAKLLFLSGIRSGAQKREISVLLAVLLQERNLFFREEQVGFDFPRPNGELNSV